MNSLCDRGISVGARSHSNLGSKLPGTGSRSSPNKGTPIDQDWVAVDEFIKFQARIRGAPVRIGLDGEELIDAADIFEGVEPGSWLAKGDLIAELR